jgi:hypothetical protein
MEFLHSASTKTPALATLYAFAERAAAALNQDARVRVLWLTGSLASGAADAYSDVDMRAAVQTEDFATIEAWWPELIERVSPTVWKRRWPGPAHEAIISAISSDYMRFDLVVQSVADTQPRSLEAVRVLFDKDGIAQHFNLTTPAQYNPLASLSYVVEEFIRLLGMLPIVVGRDDIPIGMEGQMGCHSLLLSLLLMENGIDRMAMGKRHVAKFLTDEQRDLLNSIPPLAATMESIIQDRIAYAQIFLPRARRLMAANQIAYPEAFELATRQYLKDILGIDI